MFLCEIHCHNLILSKMIITERMTSEINDCNSLAVCPCRKLPLVQLLVPEQLEDLVQLLH